MMMTVTSESIAKDMRGVCVREELDNCAEEEINLGIN